MTLQDKVVIVTGAAGCLGQVIADALEAQGAQVVAWDRDADALAALAQQHPQRLGTACDLTDEAQVAAALAAAVQHHGRIDGLVNNAGLIHSRLLFNVMGGAERRHALADWQRVLDANLGATFVATSHVVEQMALKRTRGVIVNISSIAAQGNAGQSAYAAAKAGVEALTVTWARELGAMGIRVVAVAPGFVDTPSTRAALSEPVIADLARRTPLRRLVAPANVAETVLHALRNDDLTGVVLRLDGGLRL
jgi:3-oxoacyl-[acyl-carrier protein] reductase